MKKMIWCVSVFCALVMLSSCGGSAVKKEKRSDSEEMGLIGKVKKVVEDYRDYGFYDCEKSYVFTDNGNLLYEYYMRDEMDADIFLVKRHEYGDNGLLESISYFDKDNGELKTIEYIDSLGNVTTVETYEMYGYGKDREQKISGTKKYEYDNKGLLVKSYPIGKEDNATLYKCDAAGNVLEETDLSNGKVSCIMRNSYKYDKRGNITEHGKFKQEIPGVDKDPSYGKPVEVVTNTYNKQDFLQKEVHAYYTNDGKKHYLQQERVFEYTPDEHNNTVQITAYEINYPYPNDKDGKKNRVDLRSTTIEYVYNDKGDWTSMKRTFGDRTSYLGRSVYYAD